MIPSVILPITGDASDWVFIKVRGYTFKLRYDVLESSNAYFRFNMATEQFLSTSHPRALSMNSEEPLLIALFVSFLRKKAIDRSLIGDEDPYIILFNAYRSATTWEDHSFQNAVIDALTLYVLEEDPRICTLPKLVWEIEPTDSRLRQLVLDAYVWIGGEAWLTVKALDGMTGDFIMDLAKHSISVVRSLAGAETSPFTNVGCRYHAHAQGESCDHTKHDQITTVDQEQSMADATEHEAGTLTMDAAVAKESSQVEQPIENVASLIMNDAPFDQKEEAMLEDAAIVPYERPAKNDQSLDQDTAGQDVNEGAPAVDVQNNVPELDSHSPSQSVGAVARTLSTSSSMTLDVERGELVHETSGHSENAQDTTSNDRTTQATTTYAPVKPAFIELSEHPVTRMCSMGPLLLNNRSSTPMPLRARTPLVRSATEPLGERPADLLANAPRHELSIDPHLHEEAKAAPTEAAAAPEEAGAAPAEAKEALEDPAAQPEVKQEEKPSPTKRRRDDDDDDIEATFHFKLKKSPKKNVQDSRRASEPPVTPKKANAKKPATPKKTGQTSNKVRKTPATPKKATPKKAETPKKKEAAATKEKTVRNTYEEAISLE